MARNNKKRNKKKHLIAEQQRLEKIRYRKEFFIQFKTLFNDLGIAEAYDLFPKKWLEYLCVGRSKPFRVTVKEGHKVSPIFLNAVKRYSRKLLKESTIQIDTLDSKTTLHTFFSVAFTMLLFARTIKPDTFANAARFLDYLQPFLRTCS